MNDSLVQSPVEKRSHVIWRKHGFKFLSIGLSLIAFITALTVHSNAEQSLSIAKSTLQQQQAANLEADQSSALLNNYLLPYKILQERKVIASPARLQWLETLQADVNENLIPKMSFVLSPTVPATTTNTIYTHDTIGIKVTPMRMEFILLHEGDLLRLLNDMHTQAQGLFSVQACELTRNGDSTTKDISESFQVNFKGYCELLWYSLSDITSTWEVSNATQ